MAVENKGSEMKSTHKTFALWAVLIVVGIIVFQMYEQRRQRVISNLDFDGVVAAVKDNKVKSVVVNLDTREVKGEIAPEFKDQFNGALNFIVKGPSGDRIDQRIVDAKEAGNAQTKVTYEDSENAGLLQTLVLQWLPLILIVLMFMFIMRQIQSGGGKAMSFGKSRAKLLTENKNKVTFQDVAGIEEAKDELNEIVQFLKDPKKFTRLGGRIPKGVLLAGSPGTGKTLLARAIAGEAGVPFFSISGSDFVEMFVGVGASRVRDLFEQGKRNAPCLIFIDEIDAVGRHRGAGMGGGHDEREQTLNQLLVEMDGFESNEGVILIAATNRPDVLDPALLRPGRFDRRVIVNKPDLNGRQKILGVHVRKTPLANDVNLEKIARGTPGFTGADLENLVNEAALIAARRDQNKLTQKNFEEAKDKVMMGTERRSMVISEEDKLITAYHEAGHAIVGRMIPGTDPIHKVTIIPRGMALGLTQILPEKDKLNLTRTAAQDMIAFLFGGRAAEEIIYNEVTTGAGNDIERATGIARSMVCEWGMSEKLGPLAWEKKEGNNFLGMSQSSNNYSEAKSEEIDAEVFSIVTAGHQRAVKILQDNRPALKMMADALVLFETIDGAEVDMLCKGATLDDIKRERGIKETEMAKDQASGKKDVKADEGQKTGGDDPVGSSGPVTA